MMKKLILFFLFLILFLDISTAKIQTFTETFSNNSRQWILECNLHNSAYQFNEPFNYYSLGTNITFDSGYKWNCLDSAVTTLTYGNDYIKWNATGSSPSNMNSLAHIFDNNIWFTDDSYIQFDCDLMKYNETGRYYLELINDSTGTTNNSRIIVFPINTEKIYNDSNNNLVNCVRDTTITGYNDGRCCNILPSSLDTCSGTGSVVITMDSVLAHCGIDLTTYKVKGIDLTLNGQTVSMLAYNGTFRNLILANIETNDSLEFMNTNTLPDFELPNSNKWQCYDQTNTTYATYYVNMTDNENDEMYYYPFWNYEYKERKLIDDFENENYNLFTNGWLYPDSCNYTTEYQNSYLGNSLKLFNDCNTYFYKNLDYSLKNTSYSLEFITYPMLNDTTYYGIKNDNNESLFEIKIENVLSLPNTEYYNFSYWNGNSWVFFGDSYYLGYLSVEFKVKSNNVTICINGLDENSYSGCTDTVTFKLQGITNNDSLSFYIHPTYNFPWLDYQTDYVLLDEIYYDTLADIDWIKYDGTNTIHHTYPDYGDYTLTVYATDEHELDKSYKKYEFFFTITGDCENMIYFQNSTNTSTTPITDVTQSYMDSIENGQAKFQIVFFLFMFIGFLWLLYLTHDLSITLIVIGVLFLVISLILSKNPVTNGTSFVLLAIGVGLLGAKNI